MKGDPGEPPERNPILGIFWACCASASTDTMRPKTRVAISMRVMEIIAPSTFSTFDAATRLAQAGDEASRDSVGSDSKDHRNGPGRCLRRQCGIDTCRNNHAKDRKSTRLNSSHL